MMVDRNPNWNLIIKSSIEFQRWHIPHGLLSKRNKYYSIISATWNVAKNPSMSHWDWKKLSRARELLYWPGMSQEIKDPVKHCDICNGHRNEQTKQPLLQREVPKWPWRKVTTDLYYMNGDSYLIHLDCFSKFFEVLMLQDTSFTVIKCLRQNVAIHGISALKNSLAIMHRSIPVICFKLLRESSASSTLSRLYVTPENWLAKKTVQTTVKIRT